MGVISIAIFEPIDQLYTPYDIYYQDTSLPFYVMPIRAHWHYYMEILYMCEGSIRIDCDAGSYTLSEGDLFIVYPRVVHSMYPLTEGHVRYGVIKFNPVEINISNTHSPTLRALFSYTDSVEDLFLHFTADMLAPYQMASTVDRLVQEIRQKKFGYHIAINSLLVSIMVTLARVWEENGINLTGISSGNTASSFSSILEYIDMHLNESFSVQELADRCSMSYSTFARLFKHYTGRSCQEYINYIKVCKAQDLLLFTDFPISYIASEIGFSDCSHFIKTYKKIKGITPNQQRKIGFQSDPAAYETVDKSHSS